MGNALLQMWSIWHSHTLLEGGIHRLKNLPSFNFFAGPLFAKDISLQAEKAVKKSMVWVSTMMMGYVEKLTHEHADSYLKQV